MSRKLPATLDLTPLPQVLPALGEINLALWKCLAELVDNAIDGFLDLEEGWSDIRRPGVSIWLPTRQNSAAEIIVMDNGPGLTVEQLHNAVRAGYTSRTGGTYMGLYGMGFNIATARLGWKTEVLTKRTGDDRPVSLQINFNKMQESKNFQAPLAYVRDSHPQWNKVKNADHFTMIRVFNLREGTSDDFDTTEKIRNVKNSLGMVYSPILTDGIPIPMSPDSHLKLNLRLNDSIVRGIRHNVWGRDDAGKDRPARYEISREVLRGSVRGWIGIQRVPDNDAFGIDFVRNGRKIEVHNKDLFSCLHNGKWETEYPIDVHRRGGRIVGEIHMNHCRVHYTKDRFDRTDPAWDEMVDIVRGGAEFPLRPKVAQERMNGSVNESDLAKLYGNFRRNDPGGGKKDTEEGKRRRIEAWKKILSFPNNADAVKLAESSTPLTPGEWVQKLEARIKEHVLVNGEVLPSRRASKPRVRRKDVMGILFENMSSSDEFVELILDEIRRLNSGETPLAFCLCLRTLVEVTLKRMLEQQANNVWLRINRNGREPGLSEMIKEARKLCESRPECFTSASTRKVVHAFVTGLSKDSTDFMNNATHGHIIATASKAKDLSKEVARLMERLLKDEMENSS